MFCRKAIMVFILALGCTEGTEPNLPNADELSEDGPDSSLLEIIPGVGIGPVILGGTYGAMEEAHGAPDSVIEYNRVFFATWFNLGVEVVMGSTFDEGLTNDSLIVSVGTRLPDGFSGIVVPGMSREEADEALGTCFDVIDNTHCYHSEGVYLGYNDESLIKTVAIHPAYELRLEPPEMEPAVGLGGSQ